MGKIMKDGIQYGVGGIQKAESITYDNTASGMTATNVQGALDELNKGLSDVSKVELISSQLTHVSAASWEASVVKYGRVLVGNIIFSPSSDLSGSTPDVVTGGLPNTYTAIQLPFICVAGSDSGKTGRVRIANNKIQVWYSNIAAKAGNTYLIPIYAITN